MVYLIRHLQSEANAKLMVGGDYPLTPKGVQDGEELRKKIRLKPNFLISSPLIRAQQTARILFPKKDFIIDPTFREIHFGDYEGTKEEDNEFLKTFNTTPSRLHEVTHGDNIKDRADKAIIKILDYLQKGETVIICHDTLIRSIICRLKGESLDKMPQYKSLLSNGCILKLDLSKTMEITNCTGKILI